MPKFRSIFISIVTLCAILGVAIAVIAYGRGYRLDVNQTSIKPTGLISATSDPVGAQVLVDGTLKTATNNSFNIDPGFYTVRISKESYIPWEKKIRVQGEVVSAVSAFLFPTNPSLSPLTTLGIANPTLSPDGTKVAYIIPAANLDAAVAKKAGLWYYELSEGPLGRNRDPVQVESANAVDFAASSITWSPDATQLLVEASTSSRLYTLEKPNTFTDVSTTQPQLLAEWTTTQADTDKQKLAAFKPAIVNMTTSSAKIISFSPDETKILYQATASATIPQVIVPPLIGTNSTPEDRNIKPGKFYVYDSKEDKNYFLLNKNEISGAIQWFPTSRHLLLTLKGKIDVMEYDRTNWVTIYSGPFVDNFVAPWSNGSRIIILTNLNGDALSLPNLYTVNLR
ncbi:MAG: PEGA domain-containing protein [Candidatus Gottesmanbacteria bacterium]|nr:PEGA domain-containing protein [Candidatus Gottesmanbacteria bacterium]